MIVFVLCTRTTIMICSCPLVSLCFEGAEAPTISVFFSMLFWVALVLTPVSICLAPFDGEMSWSEDSGHRLRLSMPSPFPSFLPPRPQPHPLETQLQAEKALAAMEVLDMVRSEKRELVRNSIDFLSIWLQSESLVVKPKGACSGSGASELARSIESRLASECAPLGRDGEAVAWGLVLDEFDEAIEGLEAGHRGQGVAVMVKCVPGDLLARSPMEHPVRKAFWPLFAIPASLQSEPSTCLAIDWNKIEARFRWIKKQSRARFDDE